MAWSFRQAPFLIAGPCVLEPGDVVPRVAEALAGLGERLGIPVCFKASFDKANRSRLAARRGPGIEAGLAMLRSVKEQFGLPVLTDIHEAWQAAPAADAADVLQIPAFLCRQTDLLIAAGRTRRPVNIKKGQWLAAEAMQGAVEKTREAGGEEIAVTERGTMFGYGDQVVDMRNFRRLKQATGVPVIFDATHAVQLPGQGPEGASAGQREHVAALLAAAAAAGADGFFLETHPAPEQAHSDAATQWPLDRLEGLIRRTLAVWHTARSA